MKPVQYLPAFLLAFFTAICLYAQAPQVLLVLPVAQQIDAPAGGDIVVSFDIPIDPSTINESTFRVFGRWSGPTKGLFSILNNDTEVRFTPTDALIAGEWMAVSLTTSIQSAGGENMTACYAWNFWIATAPGILDQQLRETIELRLPGETYLQTYGAYAGDMNNDGFSDLVAVNESSDDLRILLNDGEGNYPEFEVYDTGDNSTPSPSEGADFNNDGEIDLVVTTAWDTEVRVLTGDGEGSFTNMDTYYTSNGVRGIVVGDFNGDGWDDMLTTNRLDGNISIFINDGDGTFTESNMDLPGQDETACAMTDANGDGIMDVFFASYNSQKLGILLGDGNGGFTLSSEISVTGRPWMVAAGDLNGDGHADIASVNSNANRTAVAFGDGMGGLSAAVHFAPPNHGFPLAIDLGDIDGDGDLEMITSNYSSDTYTVFENNGDGQFTTVVTLNAPAASSCAILHDRDNDGDLDITGTDEEADVILLFENTGGVNAVQSAQASELELRVSPNPATQTASITYNLDESATVTHTIYRMDGSVVKKWKKDQPSGNHTEVWDVYYSLDTGTYLFEVSTTTSQATRIISIIN